MSFVIHSMETTDFENKAFVEAPQKLKAARWLSALLDIFIMYLTCNNSSPPTQSAHGPACCSRCLLLPAAHHHLTSFERSLKADPSFGASPRIWDGTSDHLGAIAETGMRPGRDRTFPLLAPHLLHPWCGALRAHCGRRRGTPRRQTRSSEWAAPPLPPCCLRWTAWEMQTSWELWMYLFRLQKTLNSVSKDTHCCVKERQYS